MFMEWDYKGAIAFMRTITPLAHSDYLNHEQYCK